MATIVQKALSGQKEALTKLYEDNTKRIYYVSQSLLRNPQKAKKATEYIIKNLWKSIDVKAIKTEDDFSAYVLRKTVDHCKYLIIKTNPKAFNIPKDKNFLIKAPEKIIVSDFEVTDYILDTFKDLQRLIFVMHTYCKYSKHEMSSILKIDMRDINAALDVEETNVIRLLQAAGQKDKLSYSSVIKSLEDNENNTLVPENIRQYIKTDIENKTATYENKQKKKNTALISVCIVVVLGLLCLVFAGTDNNSEFTLETTKDTQTTTEAATDSDLTEATDTTDSAIINSQLTYYAEIDIQDYGTITVELDEESAPITVENFVSLAESGFYDGLTFHRIIEDFMMQGGDPDGNGTGGSDETIVGEFSDNGYDNSLSHTRGAIAMARSSDYDSASSQFFIVHEDSTQLDGQYAVFGYVTEGMDIVDEICESAEPTDDNGTIPAESQPVINSITIVTE